MKRMIKIDSHQHYWKTSRTDYGWLQSSKGRIYADYMPEDLKPLLKQFNIDKTIIVQAAPTTEETDFMLQIADNEETVAGVVGWLDLESDDFEQTWLQYSKHPKFVGFRPMIQNLPSEWIIGEKIINNLKKIAEAQFPIDLQANQRHLPYLIQMMTKVPNLKAVVNHLAKPSIDQGEVEPWATQIKEMAAFPNVMCKLSEMVSTKMDGAWSKESIKPYAEHVIQSFGKNKVMFGSDWPVCLYSATYEQVVDLFEYCISTGWSDDEIAQVYGENAIQFYKLKL